MQELNVNEISNELLLLSSLFKKNSGGVCLRLKESTTRVLGQAGEGVKLFHIALPLLPHLSQHPWEDYV